MEAAVAAAAAIAVVEDCVDDVDVASERIYVGVVDAGIDVDDAAAFTVDTEELIAEEIAVAAAVAVVVIDAEFVTDVDVASKRPGVRRCASRGFSS